jgi:hypothetical protein
MDAYEMKGSSSIQEALRLGKAMDIYYYTSDTTKKASIPTVVDTRFYQDLTSKGAGSSTFIISVDQGIGDVILGATLPAQGVNGVDYTGLALARGWLYALINRVSVRYGSSSQYFWTGAQMLIESLREMPNPTTRDQLFQLGGALMTSVAGANPFAGDNLSAFAYINLPHNSPNGSMGKPNPFPSELIGQPIVVTLELNPLQAIFSSANALGDTSDAPRELESAYFQVRQVHAKDSSDLMTMPGGKSVAYSFPTKAFYQNEIQVGVGGGGAVVPGVPVKYQTLLTGFRNGEVRSIFFWVTKNSDVSPVAGAPFVKNFTSYVLPKDIELLYNGTVFYRALGSSTQMWSLVTTETPPVLQDTHLSISAGSIVATSTPANWVEIPFSQVFEQLSGSHMYVAGKLIQNAVVNLSLTMPDNDAYTIHAVYSYNCALMISDRQCEYAF